MLKVRRTCMMGSPHVQDSPRPPWRPARAPLLFSQAGWNRRTLSIYLSLYLSAILAPQRSCPGPSAPCLAAEGRRQARAKCGAAGGAMAHLLPSGHLPAASASARRGAPAGLPAALALRRVRRVVGPLTAGRATCEVECRAPGRPALQ